MESKEFDMYNENKRNISPELRMKYILSSAIWFGSFVFGMSYNVIPPVLTDLEKKFESSVDEIAKVFSIIISSYVAGALICGTLFNYWNRQLMLIGLMYTLGICIISIPLLPSKTSLFVEGGFHGFTSGAIDTAQIVWILEIWKGQAGVYVMIHYFFFALGTFMAPSIVTPFLGSVADNMTTNLSLTEANLSLWTFNRKTTTEPEAAEVGLNSTFYNFSAVPENSAPPNVMDGEPSRLIVPFAVTGALICLSASYIFFLFCYKKYEAQPDTLEEMKRKQSVGSIDLEIGWTKNKILMVILSAVTLSAYQGMEVSAVQFLPKFAQYVDLKLDEKQGSELSQGLTGAFTLGRFLGIFVIVFKAPPTLILLGNILLAFVGNVLLCFWGNTSFTLIWVGSVLLGSGYSTIFPCFYDYIEKFLTITNGIGTAFIVAGGTVALIYPLFIGEYIEDTPLLLTYLIFNSIALCTLSFAVIYIVTSRRRKQATFDSSD